MNNLEWARNSSNFLLVAKIGVAWVPPSTAVVHEDLPELNTRLANMESHLAIFCPMMVCHLAGAELEIGANSFQRGHEDHWGLFAVETWGLRVEGGLHNVFSQENLTVNWLLEVHCRRKA